VNENDNQEKHSLVPSFMKRPQSKVVNKNSIYKASTGQDLQEKLSDITVTFIDTANQNNNDEDVIKKSLPKRAKLKIKTYLKRYEYFIKSPKTRFLYDTLFYMTFLSIYSYMLLCEFSYFEEEIFLQNSIEANSSNEEIDNLTLINNNDNNTIGFRSFDDSNRSATSPKLIEYIITIWVLSFFVEEMKQVI
jgi:hypothetical protein